MSVQVSALQFNTTVAAEPFLRTPPFPGFRNGFVAVDPALRQCRVEDPEGIADLLRNLRVGGTYWAAQPKLPSHYLLVRSVAALDRVRSLWEGVPVVLWIGEAPPFISNEARTIVTGECDPWHMLSGAVALISADDDEVARIADLLRIAVYRLDDVGQLSEQRFDGAALIDEMFSGIGYLNPFTGEPMAVREAVELCGFWRRLIDSNRDIQGGLGFAFWKRDNIGPLLWNGSEPFRFLRSASEVEGASRPVAVWRSKAPADALHALADQDVPLIEVEDGFLRSQGLGADCVPPLSITVDRLGAYFDPSKPSELECLLQDGPFDEAIIERARLLRRTIVESGLSKYSRSDDAGPSRTEGRRHILVPGQVEDDRSVQTGGCGLSSNLELLMRVREQAPDARILYKPHPDVVAGHRKGAIPDRTCLQYADEIVGDASIVSLIAMVDEVHVNTSLTGFEALMREKPVTTYGVPFYAGWGLTTDLGAVPARRTARRGLDELVAAALLLYPRYLDPTTGLPCPPEVVVARLCAGDGTNAGLIVTARRLQGKLMRSVRSLVS